MSSHRAMKALGDNPDAVRSLARSLLAMAPAVSREGGSTSPPCGVTWTDWEIDFLESMGTRETSEPLSMRQREVLAELQAMARRYTSIDGLSVRSLIDRAYLERFDLDDEEAQAFIETLKASVASSVSGRERGRLLSCCRRLGIIEAHHGAFG